eukprot:2206283-Lingulodinium_polyedra.AAC.1
MRRTCCPRRSASAVGHRHNPRAPEPGRRDSGRVRSPVPGLRGLVFGKQYKVAPGPGGASS